MLHYHTIPVTPFQQNCSIVWCDETLQAAVIDPGGELEVLLTEVKRRGLTLTQIWQTHGHIDHAGGTAELAQRLQLPIIGPHPADQVWIDGLPEQSKMFGFAPADAFTPTRWLYDGDSVSVGHCTLNVRHCPGHTPGHVVFHAPEIGRAFVGDVLFAGSIGRTDLAQGDHDTLIAASSSACGPWATPPCSSPAMGRKAPSGANEKAIRTWPGLETALRCPI